MTNAAPRPVSIHSALDQAQMTPLHWRIWLLSAMGVFLDAFDLFIIGAALPIIARDLSLAPAMTGLIAAASPLGAILGAAIAGHLADRLGRKQQASHPLPPGRCSRHASYVAPSSHSSPGS